MEGSPPIIIMGTKVLSNSNKSEQIY